MPPLVVQRWVGREGNVSAREWYCSITDNGGLVAQSRTAAVHLIAMGAFIEPGVRDSQQLIGIGHGLVVSACDTQIIPTTLAIQNFIRTI